MMNFLYTKNSNVIEDLAGKGSLLIKKREDGVHVYVAPPTSNFQYEKQKDTWLTDQIVF